MEHQEELRYRIALSLLPGIGPVAARALLQHCGSAKAVFHEKRKALQKIQGVSYARIQKALKSPVLEQADKELHFIARNKIKVLWYEDEDYPRRLRHCGDAPVLLYFRGECNLNAEHCIAIVGTRSSTQYGEQTTRQLIDGLIPYQPLIISGLAFGIDICAHQAALASELPTVGVTAHGLDRIYPPEHRSTAKSMTAHGGILTEYISGTNPDRVNFPARNRIVAGMCDAVIVIEASERGGALITADLAIGYHRDVFAIPGRTGDHFSKGCNMFIRENKAGLITSAEDLIWQMGWSNKPNQKSSNRQATLFVELSEEEQRIRDILLETGQCGIDFLIMKAETSFSRLASIILQMELKGALRSLPGKRYELCY